MTVYRFNLLAKLRKNRQRRERRIVVAILRRDIFHVSNASPRGSDGGRGEDGREDRIVSETTRDRFLSIVGATFDVYR